MTTAFQPPISLFVLIEEEVWPHKGIVLVDLGKAEYVRA
jgi:hypothetical protein